MTISTPVKAVVLAGLVCALALAGVALLATGRSHSEQATVRPATHRQQPAKPARPAVRPAIQLTAGLPQPLHRALLAHRTVVAVVYAPGVAADTDVVAAARDGARSTAVGFAALDVASPAVANALHSWQSLAGDPAVLVVQRPGQVVAELDGWSDSTMVAETVANTR